MSADRKIQQLQQDLESVLQRERRAMAALHQAAELVSFAPGLSKLSSPEPIVAQILAKAQSVLEFSGIGVFLFDERDHDLVLAGCAPENSRTRLQKEMDTLIEQGAVAWAVNRGNYRFVTAAHAPHEPHEPHGQEQELLLQSISTPARVRGVFLGILAEDRSSLSDIQLPLFFIVMQQGAQLLESFELYNMHRRANVSLTENVRLLQAARRELAIAHEKLEEKVEERTQELKEVVTRLEDEVLQRRQVQEKLHNRETTLRALFNATDNLIIMVNKEGGVLTCNNAACEVFGANLDILRGKRPHELMPPDRAKAALNALRTALREKQPVYYNHSQGEREYSVKLYPVESEGMEAMVAMFGQDVTERRRAERAVRESESRYRSLFEDSPVSLWEEDCSAVKQEIDSLKQQGVTDFRAWLAERPEQLKRLAAMVHVVDVNRATVAIYGAASKKELLQGLDKVLHKDGMDCLLEIFLTLAQGGLSYHGESVNHTLDGRTIDVAVQLNVLPGYEQSMKKVVVSIMDVTESKSMERDLLQAKEAAEAANKAKSDFLANMSHEMRTPLNGVLGMTQILQGTELAVDQQEYVETIQDNSLRLMHMVNDLLDLSNINGRRFVLDEQVFSINNCLKSIAAAFQERCSRKGLAFNLQVDPHIPDKLVGDMERLKQVFVILLDNAVTYTDQGSVKVCIASVPPRRPGPLDEKAVWLHCSVADTGIGISEHRQKHIFDTFELGESYLTKRYSKAGLGLTIARGIVEKMGGEIWMQSEQGVGSTFFFSVRFKLAATSGVREAVGTLWSKQ